MAGHTCLQTLEFDQDDDRYVAELTDYVAIPSVSRDSRSKERKKYGQKGARKRFQYSKR